MHTFARMNPFSFYLLLSLLLIGFAFQSFVEAHETKSLACVLVEEIGGGGSSNPRTIRQRPVELCLMDPLNLIPEAPITSSPETLHLHVTDPSGKLLSPRLSLCEMTYLLPQEVPLAWVRSLTEEKRSPRALGHPWYSLSVKDDISGNAVSAVLGPKGEKDDQLAVFLAVYSTSATLYARLGDPLYLPCGFWRGQQSPFATEWRHRALGDGKVLYAYNGRLDRIEEIFPGYEMNFSTLHSQGNASLLVDKVAVSDHGTFLCTVYLPYIRAQRDMQLEVTALPTVTFLPNPLFARPNGEITLSCEASHFHPLEISVELLVRLPGDSQSSVLPGVSLSTHTHNKDGTFSLTASLSIITSPEHHGARYFCRVRHISVPEGVTRSSTLHVAGVAGLSLEDGMYLFAAALSLYGSLTFLHRKFKLFCATHESKKDE